MQEILNIKRISYAETKPFLLNIHYARRMPCIQYAYGLFENNLLIGIVTFGQPASPALCKGLAGEENRKRVLELNRLVFLPKYNGENRASYLVSHALKLLPERTFVVSYADWGGVATRGIYLSSNEFSLYWTNKTKDG